MLLSALLLGACANDKKAETPAAIPTAGTAGTGPDEISLTPAARAKARQRIDSLEARIREAVKSPTKAPDIQLAMYTIQAYQYFAADFPQDSLAPLSLDRAGQLYGGVLNDYQKAVEYYEKAYQKYPDYRKRPQLLLQQGLACEAGGDTAAAATAYTRLLTLYPDKAISKQARGLLKVLRMSDAARQKVFGGAPSPGPSAQQ